MKPSSCKEITDYRLQLKGLYTRKDRCPGLVAYLTSSLHCTPSRPDSRPPIHSFVSVLLLDPPYDDALLQLDDNDDVSDYVEHIRPLPLLSFPPLSLPPSLLPSLSSLSSLSRLISNPHLPRRAPLAVFCAELPKNDFLG